MENSLKAIVTAGNWKSIYIYHEILNNYWYCLKNGAVRARGYKTYFILNSIEHKILIVRKYENTKKFSIFRAQISLECYFSCS